MRDLVSKSGCFVETSTSTKVYRNEGLAIRFRDSLAFFPLKLKILGQTLCPHLGPKGTIPHEEISLSTIWPLREQLLSYMRQDVLLLGGIMLKAQSLCWERYGVDIENVLSSLALTIFRKNYYNEEENPIYVLNQNQDTFIWRGDFGGHSDLYLPEGENLWYYDQNSLFPSVMASEPMPAGARRTSLEDQPLESLFGFFEALVQCPDTMERPFLPYRSKEGSLLFPTGAFRGVYFSEELKYAITLGYQITARVCL